MISLKTPLNTRDLLAVVVSRHNSNSINSSNNTGEVTRGTPANIWIYSVLWYCPAVNTGGAVGALQWPPVSQILSRIWVPVVGAWGMRYCV